MSAQLATETGTRIAPAPRVVVFSGTWHDESRLQEKSRARLR
jgi:hypothetical protein